MTDQTPPSHLLRQIDQWLADNRRELEVDNPTPRAKRILERLAWAIHDPRKERAPFHGPRLCELLDALDRILAVDRIGLRLAEEIGGQLGEARAHGGELLHIWDRRVAQISDLGEIAPVAQFVVDALGKNAAALLAYVLRAREAGYLGLAVRADRCRDALALMEHLNLIERRPLTDDGGARVAWADLLVPHAEHGPAIEGLKGQARRPQARRLVVVPNPPIGPLIDELTAEIKGDE